MGKYKVSLKNENDILIILYYLNKLMTEMYFSESEQQKVFVSSSELARNALYYAKKGIFICEGINSGIRITVKDEGPGITNLEKVLEGKKSPTSKGLGLGISSVYRLMDEVNIETKQEGGTKIVATKWKDG